MRKMDNVTARCPTFAAMNLAINLDSLNYIQLNYILFVYSIIQMLDYINLTASDLSTILHTLMSDNTFDYDDPPLSCSLPQTIFTIQLVADRTRITIFITIK